MLFNTENSIKHQLFVYAQLNDQTVLFQAIQFSLSHLFSLSLNVEVHRLCQNSFIWLIDRTLSSAMCLGQSWPGSDGKKAVLRIPKSSSITGASPSDYLVSYQDTRWGSLTPLQWCSWCILQPQPTRPEEKGTLFSINYRFIKKTIWWCSRYIQQTQPNGLGKKKRKRKKELLQNTWNVPSRKCAWLVKPCSNMTSGWELLRVLYNSPLFLLKQKKTFLRKPFSLGFT